MNAPRKGRKPRMRRGRESDIGAYEKESVGPFRQLDIDRITPSIDIFKIHIEPGKTLSTSKVAATWLNELNYQRLPAWRNDE